MTEVADHVTQYLAFCPKSSIDTVKTFYKNHPKADFVAWITPHGGVIAYSVKPAKHKPPIWKLRDKRRKVFFEGTRQEMMIALAYEITLLFMKES